ncbi:MAG: EamA family transporter [Chloroflexota bacterium]|nr:EamA family transporter [Chloroflexota bacterium]
MDKSRQPLTFPDKTAHHVLAYAAVWFAVIAWGTSFVAARILLHSENTAQTSLSPTVLAALRFSIASLFFIVPLSMAIVRRQLSVRQLVQMAFLGQIAFSFYFWLQYTGVQKTNASISSILVVGLIPGVTAFLSHFTSKEHLSLTTFGALLLGFLGVAIIVWHGQIQVTQTADFLFGALCLVGNAFAFAAYSNLSKRWMQGISPLIMTGGTMVSGAIGLVVLSLVAPTTNHWSDVARLDTLQWEALLFLAIGCSVIAYLVYNFALTKIDASRVAAYIYFEPVVAILLGVTLLGETFSWQTIFGTGAIGVSVAAVNLMKK